MKYTLLVLHVTLDNFHCLTFNATPPFFQSFHHMCDSEPNALHRLKHQTRNKTIENVLTERVYVYSLHSISKRTDPRKWSFEKMIITSQEDSFNVKHLFLHGYRMSTMMTACFLLWDCMVNKVCPIRHDNVPDFPTESFHHRDTP